MKNDFDLNEKKGRADCQERKGLGYLESQQVNRNPIVPRKRN